MICRRGKFYCHVMRLLLLLLLTASLAQAQERRVAVHPDDIWTLDVASLPPDLWPTKPIADPLEPLNRFFFLVNDQLYVHIAQPAAASVRNTIPYGARGHVRNFFSNLGAPVRLANCLLQAKFDGAGIELSRFAVNSTIGLLGLYDPASAALGLEIQHEDFGQTLGAYGVGPGIYICWPVLGPSSARDTFGMAGDALLDPVTFAVPSAPVRGSVKAVSESVEYDWHGGMQTYDEVRRTAPDPYATWRDQYHQHRTYDSESNLSALCQRVRKAIFQPEGELAAGVQFRKPPVAAVTPRDRGQVPPQWPVVRRVQLGQDGVLRTVQ